jgi:hypothetical protein
MKTRQIALAGIAMIGLLATTGAAWAQSGRPLTPEQARQEDKNLMRNLGVGLGAAAISSAKSGRIGDAIVLGAGAALAGKKYEDARKAQNTDNRWSGRDGRYSTEAYDRDRYQTPSRWERERFERERQERAERELRERILRERMERERQERIRLERLERERAERLRWERIRRERERDRDDCRERDHRRF